MRAASSVILHDLAFDLFEHHHIITIIGESSRMQKVKEIS